MVTAFFTRDLIKIIYLFHICFRLNNFFLLSFTVTILCSKIIVNGAKFEKFKCLHRMKLDKTIKYRNFNETMQLHKKRGCK